MIFVNPYIAKKANQTMQEHPACAKVSAGSPTGLIEFPGPFSVMFMRSTLPGHHIEVLAA